MTDLRESSTINEEKGEMSEKSSINYLAIGLVLGGLAGIVFGNIPVYALLGFAIGAAIDSRNSRMEHEGRER